MLLGASWKSACRNSAFCVDANEWLGRHARADRKLNDRFMYSTPLSLCQQTPVDLNSAQGRGLKHAAQGSHEALRLTMYCPDIQGGSHQIWRSFQFNAIRNNFVRGPSAMSGVCCLWMATCTLREQRCRCSTAWSWMSLLLLNVQNVTVVQMYNNHSPYLLFKVTFGPPYSSAIRGTTTVCSAAMLRYRQKAHCEQIECRLTQRIMLSTAERIVTVHPPVYLLASLFFSFFHSSLRTKARSGSIVTRQYNDLTV